MNLVLSLAEQLLYATGARLLALGTGLPYPMTDHTQQRRAHVDVELQKTELATLQEINCW